MTIKEFVIKTLDIICYLMLGGICIASFIIGTVNIFYGAIVGIVGLLLFAFVTGYWLAISSIANNTARQVVLQEQQLEVIKKINRNIESNRELQFPQE